LPLAQIQAPPIFAIEKPSAFALFLGFCLAIQTLLCIHPGTQCRLMDQCFAIDVGRPFGFAQHSPNQRHILQANGAAFCAISLMVVRNFHNLLIEGT
jgi:hypothetical protein